MDNQNNYKQQNGLNDGSNTQSDKETGNLFKKMFGKKKSDNAPGQKQPEKKSAARELAEWIQAIAIAVVLALVVRSFVFTVVKVDGQSMEPTLHDGDRMIVWRLGYTPKAGDIIIFNPPGDDSTYWVKRVIATEGQKVKIDYNTNSVYVDYNNDGLFSDEEKLDEWYINDCECDDCGGDAMRQLEFEGTEVPEGCVFAMGDNRNHSTDSRVVGCISEDRIVGKAVVRFWPFDNMSTFKNPYKK